MDVALATCTTLPDSDDDAAPTLDALRAAGLQACYLPWDDPQADFAGARLTILRSTWNYTEAVDRFLAWTAATARVSQLWNPLSVVHRNAHKSYLLQLQEAGIPTVPTRLVRCGDSVTLADILRQTGWGETVVKPAVSAGSRHTMRVRRGDIEPGERHLRDLVARRDALVQPYLDAVEGHGERAVVWVDGTITHAVRKSPRFAGQKRSVSEALAVTAEEQELARRAVAWVGQPVLYARIDVIPGPGGAPVIMELELIEPALYFLQCAAALDRFAAAVQRLARQPGGQRG